MEHWQSQCNAIGVDAADITPESREFGRFGATWHQASKGPNVRRSDSSSAAAVPHLPLPKQGHGVIPPKWYRPVPPNILRKVWLVQVKLRVWNLAENVPTQLTF
jgi:hypothetical protein